MPAKVSKAIADGNWSNNATWSAGAPPTAGDTVYANGFTVTIDQDVDLTTGIATVASNALVVGCRYVITTVGNATFTSYGASANTVGTIFIATTTGGGTTGVATPIGTLTQLVNAANSVVAGGLFLLLSDWNLTLDVIGGASGGATSGTLVIGGIWEPSATSYPSVGTTITGNLYGGTVANSNAVFVSAQGGFLTVVGNITSGSVGATCGLVIYLGARCDLTVIGNVVAGAGTNNYAVLSYAAASVVSITGNVTGGTTTGSIGMYFAGDVQVSMVGNITGGTGSTATGIYFQMGGSLMLVGNVIGPASGTGGAGITVAGSVFGQIWVIGTVTGGTTYGILCNSNATVKIVVSGDVWAFNACPAIYAGVSNASPVLIYGSTYDVSGYCAIVAFKVLYKGRPSNAVRRVTLNEATPTYVTFYTADSGLTSAQADPSNVRKGVSYADGNLTGTMTIPSVSSTELGVAVDGDTGVAVLSLGALRKLLTSSL